MKNNIVTVTTTGKSLLELREEYGTGPDSFYEGNTWWLNEKFAKEKPEAGTYEIELPTKGTSYTKWIEKGGDESKVIHPAVLAEMVLSHFKATGERLMEDWWSWTSSLASGGDRVNVGRFAHDGFGVYHDLPSWGDFALLRVCLLRKFQKTLEPRTLEPVESLNSRVSELERKMAAIQKFLILE